MASPVASAALVWGDSALPDASHVPSHPQEPPLHPTLCTVVMPSRAAPCFGGKLGCAQWGPPVFMDNPSPHPHQHEAPCAQHEGIPAGMALGNV